MPCKHCRLRGQQQAAPPCHRAAAPTLHLQPSPLLSHTVAMSSDLIQRLQRLQRSFSALCASDADAEALFNEAKAFASVFSACAELQEPDEVTG